MWSVLAPRRLCLPVPVGVAQSYWLLISQLRRPAERGRGWTLVRLILQSHGYSNSTRTIASPHASHKLKPCNMISVTNMHINSMNNVPLWIIWAGAPPADWGFCSLWSGKSSQTTDRIELFKDACIINWHGATDGVNDHYFLKAMTKQWILAAWEDFFCSNSMHTHTHTRCTTSQ